LHGVGDSDNFLAKVLGGTLGTGLISRLLRGYTFVSRNYASREDKIFLVGFSRGAYTVRSLAGLIGAKGLLDGSQVDLEDKDNAYRLAAAVWYDYRKTAVTGAGKQDWLGKLERMVVDLPRFVSEPPTDARVPDVNIEAVAVWDTVGALGVPQYARGEDSRIDALQFCNKTLSDKVRNGLHAVSLDEQRVDFTPTLWDADPGRVMQVVFPGAHADVGGGYPLNESGLSDGVLEWMMDALEHLGVKFASSLAYVPKPAANAMAHEPWLHPPFNAGRRAYRKFDAGFLTDRSVGNRIEAGAVISDPGKPARPYGPPNMPGQQPPPILWP
jgi:uncharacterized protein (DUF2235 family)